MMSVSSARPKSYTVYTERLTGGVLWWLLLRRTRVKRVWVFQGPGRLAARLLGWLRRTRLLRVDVNKVSVALDQARDDRGGSLYFDSVEEGRDLTIEIVRRRFTDHPFAKDLGRHWPVGHLALHLERELYPMVGKECLRLKWVEWAHPQIGTEGTRPLVLLARIPWRRFLRSRADRAGIRLCHTQTVHWGGTGRLLALAWRRTRAMIAALIPRRRLSSSAGTHDGPPPRGRVAIRYYHRSISLDPAERSELFFLHDSGLSPSDVVLYDVPVNNPAIQLQVDQLRRLGFVIVPRNSWFPTRRDAFLAGRLVVRIATLALRHAFRGRPPNPGYVGSLCRLAIQYAYWRGFFQTHNARINVGVGNAGVSQVLALRDLRGVSLSYQYSLSALPFAFVFPGGEDVWAVFSPHYEQIWRTLGPPATAYVKTGFVYDGGLGLLSRLPPTELRRRLTANASTYILCFFDQNSFDTWNHIASQSVMRRDYQFLIDWLEEDPTLGLVLKPKFGRTLPQRLGPLWPRLKALEAAGRCAIILSDHHQSDVFPGTAALAADLCIGKNYGATAALEGALLGVPAVLVNTEGYPYTDLFKPDEGRVAFHDWASLRRAVEGQRTAPGSIEGFGDWSPAWNRIDPYRDGHGSVRLGTYVRWLLEGLNAGLPQVDAIVSATRQFESRWSAAGRSATTGEASLDNRRPNPTPTLDTPAPASASTTSAASAHAQPAP